MIPKLIHQTAKSVEALPPAALPLIERVKQLHPGWTYKLWTDQDNDDFVQREYPDFYPLYASYPRNIMRADVIRYLLMNRLGGLYLDTDYEMFRPFDQLNYGAVVPFELNQTEAQPYRLGNAFFASTPGHVFFGEVIEALRRQGQLSSDANVLSSTGPLFITAVYRSMSPEQKAATHTPGSALFNPPTPRTPKEYRSTAKIEGLYGIHHCFGTWRNFTVFDRLRFKAASWGRRFLGG